MCECTDREVWEVGVGSVLGEQMTHFIGGERGSIIVLVVIVWVDGYIREYVERLR